MRQRRVGYAPKCVGKVAVRNVPERKTESFRGNLRKLARGMGGARMVLRGARTMKPLKIVVRNVGVNFGCVGEVRCGRNVVATTRLFPFNFRSSAYAEAEALAADISANCVGKVAVRNVSERSA